MRITSLIRLGLLLLAMATASFAWAQNSEMPLGDVARLPKPAKKAARVITNDDFPQHPPTPATASNPNPGDSKPGDKIDQGQQKTAAPSGNSGPTNAVMAKRLADLQEAQDDEAQLIEKIQEKLGDQSLEPEQREAYSQALKQSQARLDSYKQQRSLLQQLTTQKNDHGDNLLDADQPSSNADSEPAPAQPPPGAK